MKQKLRYPFTIQISFQKVLNELKNRLKTEDKALSRQYIESVLGYANGFPELFSGLSDETNLKQYQKPIDVLLDDLFPDMLSKNEIKAAALPFRSKIFKTSDRLKEILANSGYENFEFQPRNFNPEINYVFACVIILNKYFGYDLDFFRPIYYDIPDAQGNVKNYRLFINADFVEIFPTEQSIDLTESDVDELLINYDDTDLWMQKFPPESWIFKGFTIMNFTDVTSDNGISELKSLLLSHNIKTDSKLISTKMSEILKSIFNIQNLEFGFTLFDESTDRFQNLNSQNIHSYILEAVNNANCHEAFCAEAYKSLVEEDNYFCITNIEDYFSKNPNNKFAENLQKKGVKSAILAPITKNDKLLAIMELVSYKKNELNIINATKLDDVVPYIAETVEHYFTEFQNRVKAIIQSECTSIHPSVEWKFEEEAKRLINNSDEKNASFRDIKFEDIYPLYGQIDIAGSSTQRNEAIQEDLTTQLNKALNIINSAFDIQAIPIYEQISFRISDNLAFLMKGITASSEQKVLDLMTYDVDPILHHIEDNLPELKTQVHQYFKDLESRNDVFFKHRNRFDDAVMQINQVMANLIDQKQIEAQKIFPHYFERYKTDGVEHNIYIGQSINEQYKFSEIMLQNLRLWQLKTMCEMENKFYNFQSDHPLKLEARSMIFVFNSTLSIKYRMDEKHFDVDGTYNTRYEIIKKRIDKAFVKDSEERITQKGKLTIVYAQKESEREYLNYIKYLRKIKYLGDDVEILEVQDLQGVSGLKAIRANILYQKSNDKDETLTYKDLIKSLN
ncbi:GAF domain-containing protein [Psychroflexus aestuariivivens]|uniref:GAF domain-containing protein n=1 Tax=Psychroflexus aestuariivivens TaxID=1795040 RepID=UPI000FDB52DC|nr:GAF domain-containing protein [Psychroflexus aestuariivivens]